MIRYISLLLFIGLAWGQLRVSSIHNLKSFELGVFIDMKGNLGSYNVETGLFDYDPASKTIIVNGAWHCVNGIDCRLKISWEYKYTDPKEAQGRSKNITVGSSVMVSNYDELLKGIESVNNYQFKQNDTEIVYNFPDDNFDIYKEKNGLFLIRNSKTGRLRMINTTLFLSEIKKWIKEKP